MKSSRDAWDDVMPEVLWQTRCCDVPPSTGYALTRWNHQVYTAPCVLRVQMQGTRSTSGEKPGTERGGRLFPSWNVSGGAGEGVSTETGGCKGLRDRPRGWQGRIRVGGGGGRRVGRQHCLRALGGLLRHSDVVVGGKWGGYRLAGARLEVGRLRRMLLRGVGGQSVAELLAEQQEWGPRQQGAAWGGGTEAVSERGSTGPSF